VAVVITCRNYSEFVAQAIQSVASQSYPWFRCIVVDDASTDESRAVIEDTLARLADDRFLLLSLNNNVGQLAAFRLGLERLTGVFAAFLDGDDIWFPRFLECHVRAHLNSICAAPLSGSDACLVDREGALITGTHFYCAKDRSGIAQIPGNDLPDDACPRVEGDGIVLDSGAALKVRYVSRNVMGWHWVNTSAMVFRRDFVDLAIPVDGEPKERHADYILASLGHMLGGSLIIPDRLGTYRIHGRNLFATSRRIGSFQINGVDPPGSVQYANDRLVLHVLRNWDVFASLAGAEAIAEGLQRFLAANRFRELAKAANVDDEVERVLDRADRARRAYRYRLKRYLIRRYLALAAGARSGWHNA
jgi:glycosyltransferase involved in cell wall biosynthesis